MNVVVAFSQITPTEPPPPPAPQLVVPNALVPGLGGLTSTPPSPPLPAHMPPPGPPIALPVWPAEPGVPETPLEAPPPAPAPVDHTVPSTAPDEASSPIRPPA